MMYPWVIVTLLSWQENLNAAEPRAVHQIQKRQVEVALEPSASLSFMLATMTSTVTIGMTSSSKGTSSRSNDLWRVSSTISVSMLKSGATSEPQPGAETTAINSERETVTAEPQTEGEPRPDGEVEPEPESWSEPGPQWKEAFKKWNLAWHLHVYPFATAFLLIGFYAGYFVVMNIHDGLRNKYLSVCLNAMVFLFGMTRAFVLFLDPYHQGNLIKALFTMRLLWSIGGPCLTASDSLIILALLETSKVSIAPPRFQKLGTISIVICVHFVLVVVSDTLVSTYMEAKVMILMCQLFFSAWGTLLGTAYAVLAYKLDKKLFSHKRIKEKEDKIYIFLIYASAAANYFICAVMAYTMVSVFGVYSEITFVDAWHWWTLQTLFRTGEVATCVLIFTVSAKRTRLKNAMDEISEIDSVSRTFEMTSNSPLRKLRRIFEILRNRGHKITDASLSEKDGKRSTGGRNNNDEEPGKDLSTEEDDTLPPVFEAFQVRGRGRRQSLFSSMRDASIQNKILQTAAAMPAVPSGRKKRRQSLFSAMHEASINNAISNFAQATSGARHDDVRCESFESGLEPSEEPVAFPRRGRRANLFSTNHETTLDKKVTRQTLMEDITEETAVEGKELKEEERMRKPPLLKKRSSERLRQIIANLLPSKESERSNRIREDEETRDSSNINVDDIPAVCL